MSKLITPRNIDEGWSVQIYFMYSVIGVKFRDARDVNEVGS